MTTINPLAHEIFTQYWPEARLECTKVNAIAERIIELADADNGRTFNSGDLSKDDYGILFAIVYARAADLAKPIAGWCYLIASESLCGDQDAEDNRDSILSQAWQCWRTRDAAVQAAEDHFRELCEEYDGELMPAPDWQPNGLEGNLIWNVDGDRVIEVHPIRMQD